MKETDYYLNGIQRNDVAVLNEIYELCSKPVISYVKKNSGSEDDAWDVFQDGLLIVFKKIKNKELTLTSSFGTYLFSVCRFVWLQKLNKKRQEEVTFSDISQLTDVSGIEYSYFEMEKQKIFDRNISKLSSECQEILKLYFLKINAKEVSEKMNYTLEYVKRKKYKCKEKLISIIKKDKEYSELINGE